MNQSLALLVFCVLAFGSSAFAGSGEIKGFRYVTCEARKCISVEAPKAWLSQSNGSFVASGEDGGRSDQAVMKMTDDGKVTREFRGAEIVSQPEIDAMTIESDRSVILVGIKKSSFEVIEKPVIEKRGRK